MQRIALALAIFALAPALISFGVVPFIGVLDIEGIATRAYLYLAAFYAPILVAAIVFLWMGWKAQSFEVGVGSKLHFHVLLALSALYLAVSAYDIVANQDILRLGISGAWKASTDAGARNSIPGAILMLLGGAPTFLFCAALFNEGSWGRRSLLIALAAGMLGLSLLFMLLLSSRNSAFICLVFICVVVVLKAMLPGHRATRWSVGQALTGMTIVGISFVILMGFSLWIFVDRATVTYGSIDLALDGFFLNYKVHPTIAIPASETWKRIFYALVQLEFYITHSIGYFSEYLNRDYCPAGNGASSFYGAFRIIDFVFRTNFVETAVSRMILPGVYLSLPGFLYLDFCQAGIIAGWIMGLATVLSLFVLFRGDPAPIFLAAFLLCTFAFAPFYSLPSTGNGFSLMLFAVGSCFCRVLSSRTVLPNTSPASGTLTR